MKMLQINVKIGSGSVGTIARDLYEGITQSGNECRFAFSRGTERDIPLQDTIRIGNRLDTADHLIKTRLFGSTATYSKGATRAFLKQVDEYKPDIIHIHGLYGYYINMELLFDYIRENGIALVSTLHSCWDYTGHCCYFDYAQCDKWKEDCRHCPQIKSYPASLFFDRTSENLQRKSDYYHSIEHVVLISPSAWMNQLVDQSLLKDIPHEVIRNGIDLSVFHKTEDNSYYKSLGLNNGKATILSVASIWDRRKGYEDLLEFAEYAQQFNVNVVAVGLSEEQMKSKPESLIGIRRTENVSQLIELYSNAAILFNPTHEDNYPTVNLESICCQTPVITYHTGGSPEALQNGTYGSVIETKDFDTLITVAKKVHSGEMQFCFDDLSSFSKEQMVKKYLSVYNDLFSRKSSTC